MIQFETNVVDREREELLYHIASVSKDIKMTDAKKLNKIDTFATQSKEEFIDMAKTENEVYFSALEERLLEQRDIQVTEIKKEFEVMNKQRQLDFKVMEEELEKLDRRKYFGELKEIFILQGMALLIGCSFIAIALYVVVTRRHTSSQTP